MYSFARGRRDEFAPKKGQNGAFEAQNTHPCQQGQQDRTQHRRGEVLIFIAFFRAAPAKTENDAAADARQKAQAVDDVPHRGDHRQRRCARGALILADHGRIHQTVNAGNQGAAKGGGQIAEIKGFDFPG